MQLPESMIMECGINNGIQGSEIRGWLQAFTLPSTAIVRFLMKQVN